LQASYISLKIKIFSANEISKEQDDTEKTKTKDLEKRYLSEINKDQENLYKIYEKIQKFEKLIKDDFITNNFNVLPKL